MGGGAFIVVTVPFRVAGGRSELAASPDPQIAGIPRLRVELGA